MTGPVAMKRKVADDVLTSVKKAGELDLKKTIALFSLNTGFKSDTIEKIIEQMSDVGYIVIKDNTITLGERDG